MELARIIATEDQVTVNKVDVLDVAIWDVGTEDERIDPDTGAATEKVQAPRDVYIHRCTTLSLLTGVRLPRVASIIL